MNFYRSGTIIAIQSNIDGIVNRDDDSGLQLVIIKIDSII